MQIVDHLAGSPGAFATFAALARLTVISAVITGSASAAVPARATATATAPAAASAAMARLVPATAPAALMKAAPAAARAAIGWFVVVARISIAHEPGSASRYPEILSVSWVGRCIGVRLDLKFQSC
jgi:hypothetical protein